jgi:hypothetical protein
MAGPVHGSRSTETVDVLANAPYTQYVLGQLIVDLTTEELYLRGAGGWVLIGPYVAP